MAGRIVRPHGVRGEVVVDPESDVIDQLRPGQTVFLGDDLQEIRLTAVRPHQRRYLVSLEGYGSRPAAESLRGQAVQLRHDQVRLPDGVYFRWQLIGLRVVTEDGEALGELVEVLGTGANDVYEVLLADGRRVLLPAIDSVVLSIDLEAGAIRVRLLPGLLDDG